jgi:hypothetical protein
MAALPLAGCLQPAVATPLYLLLHGTMFVLHRERQRPGWAAKNFCVD